MARGVGEQVVEHLHQALPVGHDPGQVGRQVDADGVPPAAADERAARLIHQHGDIRRLGRDRQRAGVDAPGVEQVADQAVHAVGLLVDDAEELRHLGRADEARGAERRGGRALDRGPLTTVDLGFNLLGCSNGVPRGRCSSTTVLSEDSFTYDSTDYTITGFFTRSGGNLEIIVDADLTTNTLADLTLVVGSTSLVLSGGTASGTSKLIFASSGVTLTAGTDITVKLTAPGTPNAAPTVANAIQDQTATVGTALSYAFPANTFADTDAGDTLTYTATKSDDSALPSWLSFAAATRMFSGMPTAADEGTVSVKVTASDGHGGSVSDTFDIVVSAAAGVTVSTSALTVTEEDTTGNTYTVVLDSQPTANVTVTVAGHAGTDVTLTPSILTFTTTTWGTAQTVTVKAGNDTDTTNDTVTLTHSAASTDSNYGGITIGSVVVTVADNDTANTAPTAANKTVTTGEDRAYAFTADDFGFDDDDADDTLASVMIVTPPALGTLALDGTAVMADDVVTKAQIDGDMLTFTPARDAHGDPYTTFTFTVNDGTDDSASAYTMTIDVTDAPVPVCGVPSFGDRREIWSGTVTVAPLQVFLGGAINGYGFELSAAKGTLLPSRAFSTGLNDYTIASIGVRVNGSAVFSLVSSDGTLTTAEAAVLRLHFCDESFDFDTTTARQASLYEWDSTLDWSPPVVTRTVYLSLPGNNVATGEPAITGTAQAGQELTADASPIMDADGLPSIFTYQWVRVDADGTSNPVDITDANAATYTLTNDDVGKRIKVKVSFTDELGSVEMRTSAATATVTAAATANTAPTAANKTVTTGEDRAYAFTADDFGFDDADAGDTLASVTIVTVPAAGTLALDGTAVVADDVVTKAQIDGDMLTFTPALDAHGAPYTTFTFTVNDGTDDSASAYTMTIDVTDTPATVTVAVTSTPTSLADTYGFGETIVITVTASEAVEVVGDPEFEFSMNNPGGAANDVPATYDGTRSSPTTIVFTYTVQAGDMDSDGIWIGDHSRTFMLDVNDRIRTASQQIDIDRSHPEKGTLAGHKVNGSLGAPTVPPDPTAPTLVSATATTLTIEWTHPGDGGSPLTRNFIEYRVEGTTDWTNWYRGETPTPVTRTVIRNLAAATAYDVRVHSTNAIGNSQWTQSATAFSTLAGTAATGAPTITGTAAVGQPLAVDLTGIADADGLTNASYSYQWVRVDADGLSNPADITDATDATYTLVDADLGKTLKVRVTFDDDGGNTETRTSAATATVTPAAGVPHSPIILSATVGVGQVVLVWKDPPAEGIAQTHYEYRSSAGAMIAPDAMWQQVQSGAGTRTCARSSGAADRVGAARRVSPAAAALGDPAGQSRDPRVCAGLAAPHGLPLRWANGHTSGRRQPSTERRYRWARVRWHRRA